MLQQAHSSWYRAQQENKQGHILRAFHFYQQSLRIMDQVENPSCSFLQESGALQTEALSLAGGLLEQYSNAGSRLLLLRYLMPLYEKAISTSFTLYAQDPKVETFEKAFSLAEQSRNRMLTEAVKSAGLKAFRDVPPSVIEQQQQWSSRIFIYRNLLDAEAAKANPDQGALNRYTDTLRYFEQQADSLNFKFSKKYPAYYQLMHRDHFASAAGVQRKLKGTHRAVLEYFCGDAYIYLFCITPTQLGFRRIIRDSAMNDLLLQFQKTILGINANAFAVPAFRIYQRLLEPAQMLLNDCNDLTVIHDGVTASIPFEALLRTPATAQQGYKEFDYMIRHYCISYALSSTLWLEQQAAVSSGKLSVVGFAPVFSPEMKTRYQQRCPQNCDSFYLALPEQRQTLRFAKEIIEVIPGRWYTSEEATVANFRRYSNHASIIHLASHAIFDAENPMNSRIVFAKEGCDTFPANGYIRASDLYNMKINAPLAILGSCQTGFGRPSKGEGSISLAYAFSYAGCSSLVYSLWSVDEKMTAELMRNFYEGLSQGLSKDQALHQAKLSMLEQSTELTANPLYWAGFVFSGDTSPLCEKERSDHMLLYLMVGGALLTAFIIFFKRKNKVRK